MEKLYTVDTNGNVTESFTYWRAGKNGTGTCPNFLPTAVAIPLKAKYRL